MHIAHIAPSVNTRCWVTWRTSDWTASWSLLQMHISSFFILHMALCLELLVTPTLKGPDIWIVEKVHSIFYNGINCWPFISEIWKCHWVPDATTSKFETVELGTFSRKKNCCSFGFCPNYPPPLSPQFGQLVPLFFQRQKRRFKRHSKWLIIQNSS